MRVTDSMFFTNMQRSVAQRQVDYSTAQQRATSGKRVLTPSDDPWAFAQARAETGNLTRAQGYERTIGLAKPVLDTTDSALNEVEGIVTRIRNIAIQGGTDTYNGSDRATFSQELDTLRDQLIAIGNTHSGDRFLFAGYKDATPPYDSAGLYSGDANVQQVEIGRGIYIPLGVNGEAVFGTAGSDIFTTIKNMQTALTTGTSADLSNIITEVDQRFEQVRSVHSLIGNHSNAADIAESVATRSQDLATLSRSSLVDIDAAKAYTDLARAQTALSAAIEIAGQLPPPGLVGRGR
jgi:flagellar hook-associated protein 3 FlgL